MQFQSVLEEVWERKPVWVPFHFLSWSFKQKFLSGFFYAGLEHPEPHQPLVRGGENFSESVSICVEGGIFLPSATDTDLFILSLTR